MRNTLLNFLLIMLFLTAAPAAALSQEGTVPPPQEEAPADTAASDTAAVEEEEDLSVRFDSWLLLGPVPAPFPVFHEEEKKDSDASYLLGFEDMKISSLEPFPGGRENGFSAGELLWKKVEAGDAGIMLGSPEGSPLVAYLAAWVYVPRWMKIEVEARSTDPFEMFIDGESIIKSTGSTGTGECGDEEKGSVELKQGKHALIVKAAAVPGDSVTAWLLDAKVRADKEFSEKPSVSTDPSQALNISHILDTPNVSSIEISPDGKLVLIAYWRFLPPEGERERWMEIRNLPKGELFRTIRDSGMTNVDWAPSGRRLSYVSSGKGGGSIRILDLDTGEVETVVDGVKDLGGYTWSPDGTYMAYYTTERDQGDSSGIKRLRGIQDRTDYARNRTSVFLASVPGGTVRKLATGKYDSHVSDIDPSGRKILITRGYEELSERPYSRTELYLLDLDSMSTELLWKGRWMRNAVWSPDGKQILVSGGPSTFGEIGLNVPEGTIPNDYDVQLYIFDPVTKSAEAITKDFDPAVGSFAWSKADGRIYFVASSTSFRKLYRYDPRKKTFKEYDIGVDVVGNGDICPYRPVVVFSGSGADQPLKIYSVDLRNGKTEVIHYPGEDLLRNVRLGRIENWDFTSEEGKKIIGRVHYPPDFDPEKKYPCIVYYYGGTSPVDRTFGGRYPKNLWAAKGYVVYVLQPSGATGFGQEFSTAHVNDWGRTTVGEIIYGTRKFLEAHPFVNPYRVGCIGASFGGFMTQLIITRTDIFAAAISHAGISMISSYWGEGYWGYGYNAVSAAESFPWNRPDIYVDQSPLFAADKIVTPLLLLHGASDTNVPPGESEQMYTALKLLGKEVEYIKYDGQNHFILDYKKRKAWSDAQIAWYDKWLKDQPQWWEDMYPPLGEPVKRKPDDPGSYAAKIDEESMVLLGDVTRQDIIDNIPDWDREYYDFTPDEEAMSQLGEYIFGADFTVVLGTWCSDSRREVPRFWKILETLGYPLSEVKMYAVGSSRFTADMPIPAHLFNWSRKIKEYYGVEFVETIIVSRGGEEIGRIIEAPEQSIEKELLSILSKGN